MQEGKKLKQKGSVRKNIDLSPWGRGVIFGGRREEYDFQTIMSQ
jgi:hypothetical protein